MTSNQKILQRFFFLKAVHDSVSGLNDTEVSIHWKYGITKDMVSNIINVLLGV